MNTQNDIILYESEIVSPTGDQDQAAEGAGKS